ncbi:hypothetical protein EDD16DRAFT_1732613 [Pisolithus croceorrhizus]|nr:hypothetical protein EDD16DRAFT_1732613 [Pisolithus croceorrhizus]
MERRGLSQSTWDPKLRRPLLTIEFKFYPPVSPTAEVVRNTTSYCDRTPQSQYRRHFWTFYGVTYPDNPSSPGNTESTLYQDWVPPLVHPHLEDPESFAHPDCYPTSQAEFYHKLDPTSPLLELLRNTHFVEFPTIHIFDRDASSFRGTVVDKTGRITRHRQDEAYGKAPKRRKNQCSSLLPGYLEITGAAPNPKKTKLGKKMVSSCLEIIQENEVMEAASGVLPFP